MTEYFTNKMLFLIMKISPSPGTVAGKDAVVRPWRYEFDQLAGETVFVPCHWHHAVLNVTDTVAVTHNYVCAANLEASWRAACDDAMEPAMARRWRELIAHEKPELLHLMDPALLPAAGLEQPASEEVAEEEI